MIPIPYSQVRKGMVLVGADGRLYYVVDHSPSPLGAWIARLRVRLKSLETGAVTEDRVRPDDKVLQAALDRRVLQFVYQDGDGGVFLDPETHEQFTLPRELAGETLKFLAENSRVGVAFHDGAPLSVELPATVELRVTEVWPGAPSGTAVLETGLKCRVPPSVQAGDVIVVDTHSGDFVRRAP